jgi:hypothetical protein
MMKNYMIPLTILISLSTLTRAQDVIIGGNMENADAWQISELNMDPDNSVTYEFNYTTDKPAQGEGGCLYLSGTNTGAAGGNLTNMMFYQSVTLQRGTTYLFDGAYKDVRTDKYWTEVYVGGNEPAAGSDYGGDQGAVFVSGFKSTNWEAECPGDEFDGSFAEDACTPGTTNTVFFEGEGDTTVYFGFRSGIWDDAGAGLTFEVFIDNISLVPGEPTALNEELTSGIGIYPNPFTNRVNITSSNTLQELRVIDLTGKTVYQQDFTGTTSAFTFDLGQVPSGIYCFIVKDSAGNTNIVKTVKQ